MVMLKDKHKKILVVAIILFMLFIPITNVKAAYICRSQECLAAQKKEAEYQAEANKNAGIASTYEAAVAQFNSEIAAIEASIEANQAIADDLAAQILETEKKLNTQQDALAELLIDMHFSGDAEPIRLLASSKSISDFAEKQTREEVIKTEISLASAKVKKLKADLEQQKATVDDLIAEQNEKRAEVAAKRAEKTELMAKYKDKANEYAKYADQARKDKEALMDEIADETAACQYTGKKAPYAYKNTYPQRNQCPIKYNWNRRDPGYNISYPSAGLICQCTSYAGHKAQTTYGISFDGWNHAKYWGWDKNGNPLSSKGGYRVDTVVEAGTVAVSKCGKHGHVMWVESVNNDGTINVTEYNNYGSSASGKKTDFGARTGVSVSGLRFIHFK